MILCADVSKTKLFIHIQNYKCSKYLKTGGKLVYSTCTFSRIEDEDVAEWFAGECGYDFVNLNDDVCQIFFSSFLLQPKWHHEGNAISEQSHSETLQVSKFKRASFQDHPSLWVSV